MFFQENKSLNSQTSTLEALEKPIQVLVILLAVEPLIALNSCKYSKLYIYDKLGRSQVQAQVCVDKSWPNN